MEEQVLGKINGDFTNRDSESYDSQVMLIQMLCLEIKSYQSYRNNNFWLVNRICMIMQDIIMTGKVVICSVIQDNWIQI